MVLPPAVQADTRHHLVVGHNRQVAHPVGPPAPVALPADLLLVEPAVLAAVAVLVVPQADDLPNVRVGVVAAAKNCSR